MIQITAWMRGLTGESDITLGHRANWQTEEQRCSESSKERDHRQLVWNRRRRE